MLIDTHCHFNFEGLVEDVDSVVARSRSVGVDKWINVCTQPCDFDGVLEIADRFEGMYATMGMHPHIAKEVDEEDIKRMAELCERENVVAIGETGLDFHYNFSKHELQRELFRKHLEIAAKMELPVVVHNRNATEETLGILDEFEGSLKKVVFHCYSGGVEETKVLLEKGYYISYTGIITFKNAETAREGAGIVPVERMMVETDCPYMSPEPMRKQRINEPVLMVHTARKLAEIKGMEFEEFCGKVTETSRSFFSI